jgi:hypothetical protein
LDKLNRALKPNLSFLILASFVISFVISRVFTSFFPSTQLVIEGYHVHHFWYGLALLAIGGWLGINYSDAQTERIAAIVFGVGGGLVGDEIGLLITLGDYYSEVTYTFVIALLAFAFLGTLFRRHGQTIIKEIFGSMRKNVDLYVGLFLAFLSSAFLVQSDNTLVIAISGATLLVAIALVLWHLFRYLIRR